MAVGGIPQRSWPDRSWPDRSIPYAPTGGGGGESAKTSLGLLRMIMFRHGARK